MDGSQLLRQQLADSQQTVRSLRAEVGQTAELLAELAHARTCNMKTEAELVAARSRLARFEHGDHARELQGQVDLALRHNLVVSDRLSSAAVLSSPTAGGRSSEEERLQREVQQLRGELQGALDAAISRASAKGESTAMLTVESVGKQAELSAVMARNSALEAEVAVLQQRDRQMQQLSIELKREMTMMEKLPLQLQALMQRAARAEQVRPAGRECGMARAPQWCMRVQSREAIDCRERPCGGAEGASTDDERTGGGNGEGAAGGAGRGTA
jgi:hypothetical protein